MSDNEPVAPPPETAEASAPAEKLSKERRINLINRRSTHTSWRYPSGMQPLRLW